LEKVGRRERERESCEIQIHLGERMEQENTGRRRWGKGSLGNMKKIRLMDHDRMNRDVKKGNKV